MAEVPVTGMLDDHTLISGQIDRLVVTDDEILILDYKTNRPPPQDETNIPDIYRRQMHAYARALSQIYPDKKIRCYLLWTDGARLMEIRTA
jgi:ATP-dependent helicase/nuclease subunit A